MSFRVQQVNALLLEHVNEFLVKNLEIPDVLVTVTRVETNPDLQHAVAFVSVLPESKRGSALIRLERVKKELNRDLFRTLTMRPVPKITFKVDELEAHANRVEDLLDQIKEQDL